MMLLEDFSTTAVSLTDYDIDISGKPALAGFFLIHIECFSWIFLAQ